MLESQMGQSIHGTLQVDGSAINTSVVSLRYVLKVLALAIGADCLWIGTGIEDEWFLTHRNSGTVG